MRSFVTLLALLLSACALPKGGELEAPRDEVLRALIVGTWTKDPAYAQSPTVSKSTYFADGTVEYVE